MAIISEREMIKMWSEGTYRSAEGLPGIQEWQLPILPIMQIVG